ncbi:hypothetical protein ERHA54_09820 [Erwinia rhapontici]|nr:hypothetical protein ERHA54_09820 [Erwinia rhapontici]
MSLHITTPLLSSRPLSLLAGREVMLKMEALQPPGSFKIRGIGLACETWQRRGHSVLSLRQGAMPVWPWPGPGAISVCPSPLWCRKPPRCGHRSCCGRSTLR